MRNRMKVKSLVSAMATNRAVRRAPSVCQWSPPVELVMRAKNCVSRKESLADIQHEEDAAVDEQASDSIEIEEENE